MNLSWYCIGHHPTKWGLGELIESDNQLTNVIAIIERLKSGKWHIAIKGKFYIPQEPSRIEAMKEVERIIMSTTNSYKALA